ncbi:thiamine ABC transporter ATP-binding protein [Glaesserella parasuis]|nr:thiamine ABC transporter ATP-binding protein [Glaesserella parasuis]
MIYINVEFDYPEMPMQFQLNVKKGERIAVIGESGAGKSTLLNLIAGFEKADRGEILLNGENHFATEPAQRPVSMLFQDNNLFPHLTVAQNIGLGLVSRLDFDATQMQQITQIAKQMGIAELLERRSDLLSGGQKQRVALARTLLRDKPILFLDEPFSALDPQKRIEMQQLVVELCQQKQLTLLMVTHQLEDVSKWCDQVVEVKQGRLIY